VKDYGAVPRVRTDETRLVQVFINLLSNAAQCLPEARSDVNEVRVSTRTDERGRAIVEVTDNGPGISSDVQKRMFDPFFTTKAVGVGTGLGLSVAHAVVTSSGGHIECESLPGRGTSFRIVLPPASVPGHSTEPPTSAARLSRARVLVIDDEPQVGKVLSRLLSKEHDVVVFESSTEALAYILSGQPFDVAFCDLMMPILSGQQIYRAVRDNAPERLDKIVFISGGAFAAETRRFLDEVPNQRLEKPFDGHQVRALVRAALRARR
jgi:CheY-like chemotaxis protein